ADPFIRSILCNEAVLHGNRRQSSSSSSGNKARFFKCENIIVTLPCYYIKLFYDIVRLISRKSLKESHLSQIVEAMFFPQVLSQQEVKDFANFLIFSTGSISPYPQVF